MTTTETLPDECIHGLVGGCVTCDGTDDMLEASHKSRGLRTVTRWSAREHEAAEDYSKTSREVAEAIGRTTNQVSAIRAAKHMKHYAGWSPKPR